MVSADWYVDPSGRFEHRYWNGGTWTNQVARAGVASVDEPDATWAPPPPDAPNAAPLNDGVTPVEHRPSLVEGHSRDIGSRRALLIGVGALAVVVVIVVAGLLPSHRSKHYTIKGSFTLTDTSSSFDAIDCSGSGGFDDIDSGTNVVIKDRSGKILANDDLGFGTGKSDTCTFHWSIRVPKASFYQVEVGHRGALTYSFANMQASDWHVDTTLGS